jgi:hypothetical protein
MSAFGQHIHMLDADAVFNQKHNHKDLNPEVIIFMNLIGRSSGSPLTRSPA